MIKSFLLTISFLILCTSCHKHAVVLEEKNPCGIVLECKQIKEIQTPTGPIYFYSLFAENVPPNMRFNSFQENLLISEKDKDFESDSQGCLLARDSKIPSQHCVFIPQNLKSGEPVKIWLVSEDNSISIPATCIPYPLEAFGRDNAHVSLIMKNWNFYDALCQGDGFEDGEEIELIRTTGTKKISSSFSCIGGKFSQILHPPEPEAKEGIVVVTILRRNGETLSLQYGWGVNIFTEGSANAISKNFSLDHYKLIEQAAQELFIELSAQHK